MPKPIVAMACAAAAAAALAGCPSLSALECQGTTCAEGGAAGGGGADAGGVTGIACGTGGVCDAPTEECCIPAEKPLTCVASLQCNGGSDIFCDDPSQCGGAPCWLCNAGGFQGTSCNYEADIVQAYHCTDPKDIYRLCRSSSECDAGSTCVPLPIVLPETAGADGGASGLTFYGCQP